jgi:hypothetical protein
MNQDVEYLKRLLPGVLGQLQRQARASLYRTRPDLWAWDYLGVELWWKQKEIALDLVSFAKAAVKAGHGVGKSYLAGVLICWWIDVHPIGEAFVASTAPTTAQINAIVWREVRNFFKISHERFREYKDRIKHNLPLEDYAANDHALPGYITSNAEWKLDTGVLLGAGRKPPDGNDDAFQGIHARYVLAVGDEACGLQEGLIQGLTDITTNENSRVLLIANPTVPASYFAKIFKEDGIVDKETGEVTWHLHTISVLDSPNFHGGGQCECHADEPVGMGMRPESLEALVGHGYVAGKKREYGENSARYKARVLGEFARDDGDNMLFTIADIYRAKETEIIPDEDEEIWLGVDVASYGKDFNVVYMNRGGHIRFVESWGGEGDELVDLLETAERVHRLALKYGASEVRIDSTAVGQGAYQMLVRICEGQYKIWEMYGNYQSNNLEAWRNGRAEWYDTTRRLMSEGKVDMDVNDERVEDELMSIQYFVPETGRAGIQLEAKKDMRKRGMKSPDFADAFVYAAAPLGRERDPNRLEKGDRIVNEPQSIIEQYGAEFWSGAGLPM